RERGGPHGGNHESARDAGAGRGGARAARAPRLAARDRRPHRRCEEPAACHRGGPAPLRREARHAEPRLSGRRRWRVDPGAILELGQGAVLMAGGVMNEMTGELGAKIKVVGVGGGGGNALNTMILADIARGVGALTVGVVTKPFMFEGKRRLKQADHGIAELKNTVDTLITIPNQRLLAVADEKTTLLDTFKKADEVLLNAVQGISDLITIPGLINVDFADVRTIMSNMGVALMGTGTATGETRATVAARAAADRAAGCDPAGARTDAGNAGDASDDGTGRTASRGAAADAGDPPRGDASSGSAAGDAGASAEAGAAPLVGRAAAAHRSVGGRA